MEFIGLMLVVAFTASALVFAIDRQQKRWRNKVPPRRKVILSDEKK